MAGPMATLSEFKSALRLNIDMLPGVGQQRHLCILISETPFPLIPLFLRACAPVAAAFALTLPICSSNN